MGHEETMCGFVCKENQDARANFYWLREASNLPQTLNYKFSRTRMHEHLSCQCRVHLCV